MCLHLFFTSRKLTFKESFPGKTASNMRIRCKTIFRNWPQEELNTLPQFFGVCEYSGAVVITVY